MNNAIISRHLNRNNQNNWLPSVFDDFFDDDWMKQANATAPAINVKESKSDYTIEVAAPGMTKEDFNVSIDEDNDLVISMEKKNEKKEGNEESLYLRREFSYTKFQQAMLLPDDVDKEKIDAKVENGVLYLTLPKLAVEAQKSPKRLISVK
jgi:HSP20 family protein